MHFISVFENSCFALYTNDKQSVIKPYLYLLIHSFLPSAECLLGSVSPCVFVSLSWSQMSFHIPHTGILFVYPARAFGEYDYSTLHVY